MTAPPGTAWSLGGPAAGGALIGGDSSIGLEGVRSGPNALRCDRPPCLRSMSDLRMEIANRAHPFQQRSQVQDRGLRQPLADELHVDRQPFPARAEPHRQAGQPGDVRAARSRPWRWVASTVWPLMVNSAWPCLWAGSGSTGREQRVVAREVVGDSRPAAAPPPARRRCSPSWTCRAARAWSWPSCRAHRRRDRRSPLRTRASSPSRGGG